MSRFSLGYFYLQFPFSLKSDVHGFGKSKTQHNYSQETEASPLFVRNNTVAFFICLSAACHGLLWDSTVLQCCAALPDNHPDKSRMCFQNTSSNMNHSDSQQHITSSSGRACENSRFTVMGNTYRRNSWKRESFNRIESIHNNNCLCFCLTRYNRHHNKTGKSRNEPRVHRNTSSWSGRLRVIWPTRNAP